MGSKNVKLAPSGVQESLKSLPLEFSLLTDPEGVLMTICRLVEAAQRSLVYTGMLVSVSFAGGR